MTKSRVTNIKAKKRLEMKITLALVGVGMGLGGLMIGLMFVGI